MFYLQVFQNTTQLCSERCPKACHRTLFVLSMNQMPWPHESERVHFYNKYVSGTIFAHDPLLEDVTKMMDVNVTEAKKMLRNSDVLSRIFTQLHFTNGMVEIQEELSRYTPASMMGSLGGILNLWVGISFITFIEILDCLFKLVRVHDPKDKADSNDG